MEQQLLMAAAQQLTEEYTARLAQVKAGISSGTGAAGSSCLVNAAAGMPQFLPSLEPLTHCAAQRLCPGFAG